MRKETTTKHNLIMVPGSTSISEQAALPTLRPDQRCLSFNMGRASDIEGGLLTIKLFSSRDAARPTKTKNYRLYSSHFKLVLLRRDQTISSVLVLVLMSRDLYTCTVAHRSVCSQPQRVEATANWVIVIMAYCTQC